MESKDVAPENAPPHATLPAEPPLRLGGWSFYFLAKLLLYWRELIGFQPLENLAFAALLLVPITSPHWRRTRTLIAIPVAVILLYYDSWLPPIDRLWSQADLVSNFSAIYLAELAGRFISWPVVAMLVLAWAGYRITARYLRVGVLVTAVLAGLVLNSIRDTPPTLASTAATQNTAQPASDTAAKNLDTVLQEFYAKEAQRSVRFTPAAENAAPFDIIFVHVCSMSWDDLQATGLDQHPLWNNFDFIFRRFNSAASYSGPSVIRIHRATCGQQPHEGLYSPVANNCYLMPSLKQAGFESDLVLNHDGHFDDFLPLIRKQGLSAPMMPLNGVPVPQRAFDNSPIYDDLAVLSRWFETRKQRDTQRVAMFYNTISLHDGNRIVAGPHANRSSTSTYKPRVEKLLGDLNSFMQHLQESGRRAVVVVVPEHGAALRGDKFQFAGLREIPTPRITMTPVGIKIIGPDALRRGEQAQVSEPTSYLAISHLIATMLEKSPFGENGFASADYLPGLPTTEFVAENDSGVMIGRGNKYFLRQGKADWKEYADPD